VVVALIAMLVAVMAGQSPGAVKAPSVVAVSAADSPTIVIGRVSTIQYKNHGTHSFDILGYSQGVTAPRDASTGQATGKRLHKPFVVTKELDAESVRLFQALVTNENLLTVIIDIYRPGTTDVYMRYTLTNAHVLQDQQDGSGVPETIPLEEVSFFFPKICVKNIPDQGNGIESCDEWLNRP
jgi:type VI secretion system secreted protein Hcp